MRRGDDLHRLRKICFALMMAAILVLGVGCSGTGSDEPAGEEPEIHGDVEQSGQPAGDASAYSAYRDVLLGNENEIRAYDWQLDTDKRVAFIDINEDGTEELLFMSSKDESLADLHIYRYDADQQEAVEIYYEYETRFRDGRGYMTDAAVAGGSKFMVFKGTEPGTLYMAFLITDETAYSDMTEYTCTPDGRMIKNWTATNKYSYYDESDVYYLNNEEVSEEEGSSYFVQAKKNYGKLIMFSGYTDIMSVFENVKSDSPAAMSFDEAINWLDDRINIAE